MLREHKRPQVLVMGHAADLISQSKPNSRRVVLSSRNVVLHLAVSFLPSSPRHPLRVIILTPGTIDGKGPWSRLENQAEIQVSSGWRKLLTCICDQCERYTKWYKFELDFEPKQYGDCDIDVKSDYGSGYESNVRARFITLYSPHPLLAGSRCHRWLGRRGSGTYYHIPSYITSLAGIWPVISGHKILGCIVKLAPKVTESKVGDRAGVE